jgi:hypothetical protein
MNPTPDDKALNEYLTGQSPISARYRELPADDVPPELDAVILAQARNAITQSSSHTKLERWRRWSVPATLAATFVLVVSLVIANNTSQLIPTQEAVTTGVAESIETTISESREQALNDAPEKRQTVTVDLNTVTPELFADKPAPDMTLESPPPPKLEMPPPPAQVVSTPEGEQQVADQAELQAIVAAAPAAPAPAMTSQPSASPREEAPRLAKASEPGQGVANRSQLARQVSEPSAQQTAREADPKLWLEYIRELHKENKTDDANREWGNFRKRYPDFKVEANDVARGPEPK